MAGSAARTGGSKSAAKSSGRTRSASRSGSSRATSRGSAGRSGTSRRQGASRDESSDRPVGGVPSAVGTVVRKARAPVLAASTATVGILLGRRLMPKRKTVLGIPLPRNGLNGLVASNGINLKSMGKRIGSAGRQITKASEQLGKLSEDVERVGKTAQRVGDRLS
jgi:hypothetical protein